MFEGLKNRFGSTRWSATADRISAAPLPEVDRVVEEALELRSQLDRVIHEGSGRLALPRIGSEKFPRPRNADWAWRPEMWRGALPRVSQAAVESKTKLGSEVTLFHDCQVSELSLRQTRNTRERDLAPYGLRLDVFKFDGSYLSVAIDLPQAAIADLRRSHLIRVNTIVEREKPLEIFARLNVQHGPNTEVQLRELPLEADDIWVEFDLAYTDLNERRAERMWLDLIFEAPELNMVNLRDITFSRLQRAQI